MRWNCPVALQSAVFCFLVLQSAAWHDFDVSVLSPAPGSRTVINPRESFLIEIRIRGMRNIPGNRCHLYTAVVSNHHTELFEGRLCFCWADEPDLRVTMSECYLELWSGLLSSSMPELVVDITDEFGAEIAQASSIFTLEAKNDSALNAMIEREKINASSGDVTFLSELRWLQTLSKFEHKAFSQNTEDGVIVEVFQHFGTTNKLAVEFGAENGTEVNSRRLWEHHGWQAILLDGDHENLSLHHNASLYQAFITPANIVSLLHARGVPLEPDLLSIDLDFNDFWVLQRILRAFRPRVVVAEINRNFGPSEAFTVPLDPSMHWTGNQGAGFPHGTGYFGMSVGALDRLATSRGYKLLYLFLDAVNALLVRSDLLPPAVAGQLSLEAVVPEKVAGIHGLYRGPRRWVAVEHGEDEGELRYEEVLLRMRDGDVEHDAASIQGSVRLKRYFERVDDDEKEEEENGRRRGSFVA